MRAERESAGAGARYGTESKSKEGSALQKTGKEVGGMMGNMTASTTVEKEGGRGFREITEVINMVTKPQRPGPRQS